MLALKNDSVLLDQKIIKKIIFFFIKKKVLFAIRKKTRVLIKKKIFFLIRCLSKKNKS